MNKKLLVIVIEDDLGMADTYRKMINLVQYTEAEMIHDGAGGLPSPVTCFSFGSS